MHLDGPLRGLRPAASPLYARREAASTAAAALLAAAAASPAAAGLADRLAARDPLQLKKPIFNVRPGETVYPAWLAGSWRVSSSFRGFQFPDAGIKKEDVMAEPTIPGFQKCSIAAIPDVGRASTYSIRFLSADGGRSGAVADLAYNLGAEIDGGLGYAAVEGVSCTLEQGLDSPE